MKILVLNGPNINMLGIREPDIYGRETYQSLIGKISEHCKAKSLDVEFFQSNHEGALVDKIQEAYGKADGIVINPAAYTHTSVALLDALKAVSLPEVLSDVSAREDFRQVSYVRLACRETFAGHGFRGYRLAAEYLLRLSKDGGSEAEE